MIGLDIRRYSYILLMLLLLSLSGCTSKGGGDTNGTGGDDGSGGVVPSIPMADLRVSEFYSPKSIEGQDDFYIQIAIKNSGNEDVVKPFKVGLYISLDPEMQQDNLYMIGTTIIDKLAAGATKYIYDFVINPSLSVPVIPGSTYYISIISDMENVILESNETNNISDIRSVLLYMPMVTLPSFVDSYEEDDIMDNATSLEVENMQKHNFYDDPNDWSKIYLSSTIEYTIETMDLGLLADTNLTLINKSQDINISDSNSGDDSLNASKIVIYPEISDNFYILTSSAHGLMGLGHEYAIEVSSILVGIDDSYENDDSYEDAQSIYSGIEQKHNFYDDDSDWLYFYAQKDANYTIETETIGVDADTEIVLYDTDGITEIARDDNGSSGSVAGSLIEWQAPSSGQYYINVISADGSTGDKRHYKVKLMEKE